MAKLLLWACALAAIAALVLAQTGSGPYQPDWNSLTAHRGIQVSVPAVRRHAIDTNVRRELDGPASTLPILREG